MTDPVEWRYTHETSRLLRGGWYAVWSLLGGMVVLALAVGAFVVARVALAGNLAVLAIIALFLLVGGPFSILYLAPMLADPDQRPTLPAGTPLVALSPGWLALAAVVGAGVLVGSAALADPLPIALFAVGIFVLLPGIAALTTTGELDPVSETLNVNERSTDIADLRDIRSLRVGGLVLAWLSYARGTATGAPRFVAFPAPTFEAVAPHLQEGIEAEVASEDALTGQVRVVLVGIGLALLAAGVGVGYLAATWPEGDFVFIYVAVLGGLFGSLFLWLGVT